MKAHFLISFLIGIGISGSVNAQSGECSMLMSQDLLPDRSLFLEETALFNHDISPAADASVSNLTMQIHTEISRVLTGLIFNQAEAKKPLDRHFIERSINESAAHTSDVVNRFEDNDREPVKKIADLVFKSTNAYAYAIKRFRESQKSVVVRLLTENYHKYWISTQPTSDKGETLPVVIRLWGNEEIEVVHTPVDYLNTLGILNYWKASASDIYDIVIGQIDRGGEINKAFFEIAIKKLHERKYRGGYFRPLAIESSFEELDSKVIEFYLKMVKAASDLLYR